MARVEYNRVGLCVMRCVVKVSPIVTQIYQWLQVVTFMTTIIGVGTGGAGGL